MLQNFYSWRVYVLIFFNVLTTVLSYTTSGRAFLVGIMVSISKGNLNLNFFNLDSSEAED